MPNHPTEELEEDPHRASNRLGLTIIFYWAGVLLWYIFQVNQCERNPTDCWNALLLVPLINFGLFLSLVLGIMMIVASPKRT
tara:strand:+ start:267 stop:512 length:246 start_codon:yes stop_codon:yes gene_type:complete